MGKGSMLKLYTNEEGVVDFWGKYLFPPTTPDIALGGDLFK